MPRRQVGVLPKPTEEVGGPVSGVGADVSETKREAIWDFELLGDGVPELPFKVARRKAENRKECSFALTKGALGALLTVEKFVSTWSGSSPMFKPFSPRDPWDKLLRLDASSDFGFGGFVLPLERGHARAWTPEERALSLAPQLKSDTGGKKIEKLDMFIEKLCTLQKLDKFIDILDRRILD